MYEVEKSTMLKLSSPDIFSDEELSYLHHVLHGGVQKQANENLDFQTKLAAFNEEELAFLKEKVAEILQEEMGDVGADPEWEAKIAALESLELDQEMFKEAAEDMSWEELEEAIHKVASQFSDEDAQLIMAKAEMDYTSYQEKQAELRGIGETIGDAMFERFDFRCEEKLAQVEDNEKLAGLKERAPRIAAALSEL